MRWLSARLLFGVALMSFALIALTASPESSQVIAQEKDKDPEDVIPKQAKQFSKVGFYQCNACHATGGRSDEEKKVQLDQFIWKTEVNFWKKNDLHRNAWDCLSQKLGQQMESVLGYKVTEDARCLVCHSVDVNHSGVDVQPPIAGKERFVTNGGMSCEACHGIATKRMPDGEQGWVLRHALPDWRGKSPEYKANYGMLDMRSPKVRAEKCASCHSGNSAEGKIVTHDMFAAGHPPLQPLEVVTFAEHEPQHWPTPRYNVVLQKLAAGKIDFDFLGDPSDKNAMKEADQKTLAAKSYYFIEGESKDTRDLVIGMVAALRSNIKLIGDEMAKAAKEGELLDYTHFDCYACHHDLKIPAGRQERGYNWIPGRPIPKPWTNEIVSTMITDWIGRGGSAVKGLEYEAARREFITAMTLKPYGVPKNVETATKKFGDLLDKLLAEMSAVDPAKPAFDKAFVEKLAKDLREKLNPKGSVAATPYIDYEVAQHYVWTLKILYGEAKAMGLALPDGEQFLTTVEKLHDSKTKNTPKLVVDLRDKWIAEERAKETKIYVPVADRLPQRMDSVKNFDSLGFRKLFD
jgi:hypothetical protein